MAQNPLNLALRLLLELIALTALGAWAWRLGDGRLRFVWVIGVPLLGALLWGIFRVPGDPGNAPVPVPGIVRLGIEGLFFGGGTWAFWTTFGPTVAWGFAAIVVIHYAFSYDRIAWLLWDQS